MIDPAKGFSKIFRSDTARLKLACQEASGSKGQILDLSRGWEYDEPLEIHNPGGLTIIGNSFHQGFKGPGITVYDPKPLIVRDLWMVGGGIKVVAKESGNARFDNCRSENADCGFDFEAIAGADISRVFMTYCEASKCNTGFRMTGPNALDPHLVFCTATECQIGFDFRQGGCGYVLDKCGGSKSGTLVWANCGYQGTIRDFTCELCQLPIQIGDNDYNPLNQVWISLLDVRGTKGDYLMDIGCSATVWAGRNVGTIKTRGTIDLKGSLQVESVRV